MEVMWEYSIASEWNGYYLNAENLILWKFMKKNVERQIFWVIQDTF